MNKYCVSILGSNFKIDIDSNIRKYGFYQIFFVEAESSEQAESIALEKLRNDEDLKQITLNSKDDPPFMEIDELHELIDFEGIESKTTGRAYFVEKKWWQFWKRDIKQGLLETTTNGKVKIIATTQKSKR